MKCVCPMGGDRTCPDDCPLAIWATLSTKDRKAQRKPVAEQLYKQGFTMEAIATQLGVHHSQIVRDLREFVHDAQIKPAKTSTNPKGAGRPKGKKSKRTGSPELRTYDATVEKKVLDLLDQGMSQEQAAADVGVNKHTVEVFVAREAGRAEAKADPEIDSAALSMTAQQKLEAAIRQHKRKLDAEFEERCRVDCMRWLNDVGLPHYHKKLAELERSITSRRGFMDAATYRKILVCLHPDRVSDEHLKKRYQEAFQIWSNLEKHVLDEKQSPTEFRTMPRTYQELMAMKAKVQAERRAKREARNKMMPR